MTVCWTAAAGAGAGLRGTNPNAVRATFFEVKLPCEIFRPSVTSPHPPLHISTTTSSSSTAPPSCLALRNPPRPPSLVAAIIGPQSAHKHRRLQPSGRPGDTRSLTSPREPQTSSRPRLNTVPHAELAPATPLHTFLDRITHIPCRTRRLPISTAVRLTAALTAPRKSCVLLLQLHLFSSGRFSTDSPRRTHTPCLTPALHR